MCLRGASIYEGNIVREIIREGLSEILATICEVESVFVTVEPGKQTLKKL